jgi:hypothetical protein
MTTKKALIFIGAFLVSDVLDFLFFCLFACLPVCLFACLPVCLFACLPVCLFAKACPYAVHDTKNN